MLTVDAALQQILAHVAILEAEAKPLLGALGYVLAEDLRAEFSIPPHDNAAMDGFAVRAADVQSATPAAPVSLRVVGEVPAGSDPTLTVIPRTAARIMTGAKMPAGADSVVRFEETTEVDSQPALRDRVGIKVPVRAGDNVRRAGEDVTCGTVVLDAGTELRPAEIGVIASLGIGTVRVVRKPRVAVLSTGDELLTPGQPLVPGKIYDANTYSVSAMVLRYGGVPIPLGIAADNRTDLTERIRAGRDCDLFISSAGVSIGDYDIVKEALAAEGEIGFWQVAIKPGKPLAFGRIGAIPYVGLPGNPVASLVAFEQFVRPAILTMQGKRRTRKPEVQARLVGEAGNRDGRRCFLRVAVTRDEVGYVATLTGPQGSGILTSMTAANGLLVIPEDVAEVRTGDLVRIQMLDWPEVD